MLLFSILQFLLHAQYSFEFIVSNPVNEIILDLYEEETGGFLAVGYQGDTPTPEDYKGLIIRISPQGDTIIKKYCIADTVFIFKRIVRCNDGNYLIFGAAAFPPEFYHELLIVKLDTNLNILWYRKHELDVKAIYQRKILPLANGTGYHIINQVFKGYNWNLMLCRINENGDLLKTKQFTELGNGQDIGDAVYSTDSSYIYIFGTGYNNTWVGSRLIIDTSYTFIYSNLLPEYADLYMNAKWFTDSTLLFSACYSYFIHPQRDDIGISETDTSFSNMDIQRYGAIDTINYPAVVQAIDFISNDSIFLAGTHNIVFDFFPHEASWISIWQLKNDLNARVEYFYGGDAYYVTYSIISTSDGGCLVAARRYDYQVQQERDNDIFILKLKREDLITEIPDAISINKEPVMIYPNPGKDKFMVNVEIDNVLFYLYDMQGKLIFKRKLKSDNTIINCSRLLPGIYIYTITKEDRVIKGGKWVKL